MMFSEFVPQETPAERIERERQLEQVQLLTGQPVTLDAAERDDLCVIALTNAISDQQRKAKATR